MASRIKRITKLQKNVEERQIILAMVVDTFFLRQLRPSIRLEFFKAPFAKTIAQWCLDYWDQVKEPPGPQIQIIFETKERNDEVDEDSLEVIRDFLESLSEEYEKSNRPTEFYIKSAEKYFRQRALEILQEDITRYATAGDAEAAEQLIAQYRRPSRDEGGYINPFKDQEAIFQAFTQTTAPLFTVPGPLGQLINDLFVREGFVTFLAPEKRGKTWWLMYLSLQAAKKNLNVAFFSVGDMSRNNILVRYGIMNTRRSNREKYCGELLIPVLDCYKNQNGTCDLPQRTSTVDVIKGEAILDFYHPEAKGYEPCDDCRRDNERKGLYVPAPWLKLRSPVPPLAWGESYRKGQFFAKTNQGTSGFRLSVHNNSSINVEQIDAILRNWQTQDEFIPDVIFIDYPDILIPEDTRKSERGQENDRWKALRRMSQDWDCLLITATQSDANSYQKDTLDESNFSEDKRKFSHVTGVITLNQTKQEKQRGLIRLGTMFLREDDYEFTRTVTVLQSIPSGQIVLKSFFTRDGFIAKEIIKAEEEEVE